MEPPGREESERRGQEEEGEPAEESRETVTSFPRENQGSRAMEARKEAEASRWEWLMLAAAWGKGGERERSGTTWVEKEARLKWTGSGAGDCRLRETGCAGPGSRTGKAGEGHGGQRGLLSVGRPGACSPTSRLTAQIPSPSKARALHPRGHLHSPRL